jgi:hypothetical protein
MTAEGVEEERRQLPITQRCRYCEAVDTGQDWQLERRKSPPASADTICRSCFARLTADRSRSPH